MERCDKIYDAIGFKMPYLQAIGGAQSAKWKKPNAL
jgi:hypothetical protein